MSSLRKEIVGSCSKCNALGLYDGEACDCMLKFRVYNRLTNAGFALNSLRLVDSENYNLPFIAEGESFINYYTTHSKVVEDKGLGLYIYSQDKGRGKTTLAHHIAFKAASAFVSREHYSTHRTYCFQNAEELLESFNKGSKDSWKATWYVLDDLGSEDRCAEWKKTLFLTSLQRLLQYRRANHLPTLITSNYRPLDLSALYQGELDSLLEIRPDGLLGGSLFRSVRVGGAEDLRLINDNSWPI